MLIHNFYREKNKTFETYGTEGPARSAVSLIFDGRYGTVFPPVHLFGNLHVEGSDERGSDNFLRSPELAVFTRSVEAVQQIGKFVVKHVGVFVHS